MPHAHLVLRKKVAKGHLAIPIEGRPLTSTLWVFVFWFCIADVGYSFTNGSDRDNRAAHSILIENDKGTTEYEVDLGTLDDFSKVPFSLRIAFSNETLRDRVDVSVSCGCIKGSTSLDPENPTGIVFHGTVETGSLSSINQALGIVVESRLIAKIGLKGDVKSSVTIEPSVVDKVKTGDLIPVRLIGNGAIVRSLQFMESQNFSLVSQTQDNDEISVVFEAKSVPPNVEVIPIIFGVEFEREGKVQRHDRQLVVKPVLLTRVIPDKPIFRRRGTGWFSAFVLIPGEEMVSVEESKDRGLKILGSDGLPLSDDVSVEIRESGNRFVVSIYAEALNNEKFDIVINGRGLNHSVSLFKQGDK
jgi:hypothetical protein